MRFRDRLRHDEATGAYYDGAIRYMMIRPAALMGIFARLDPQERSAALEALLQSVREQGGHSAATYVEGKADPALLKIIEDTAPQLGWGIWHLSLNGTRLDLSVEHSPFAEGATFEGPVCHAIAGMGEAVFHLITGQEGRAREVHCAAGEAETCAFVVEPAAR